MNEQQHNSTSDRTPPDSAAINSAGRTRLQGRSVGIYMPDLSGGGLERLQLELCPFLIAAGLNVTLVLTRAQGDLMSQVPANTRVFSLNASRQIRALMPLVRYLQREKPDVLIVHTEHTAIIALWARVIARSSTRIVVCQHNNYSAQSHRRSWNFRLLPLLFSRVIRLADRVVAVSTGVAEDFVKATGLAPDRVMVIYNGVIGTEFGHKSAAHLDHPWFAQGTPVIVAAGRFVHQKDFATLIKAFSLVRKQRAVRLVLLGDGPLREELKALAHSLGVAEHIDMPGFCSNPFPYMRAAAMVVLSSRYEGFAMVLAEALACGAPVVSTDCPYGPAEILEGGRFGRLTPVGDAEALSQAMVATLDNPPQREALRARAADFSVDIAAGRYLDLLEELTRA